MMEKMSFLADEVVILGYLSFWFVSRREPYKSASVKKFWWTNSPCLLLFLTDPLV